MRTYHSNCKYDRFLAPPSQCNCWSARVAWTLENQNDDHGTFVFWSGMNLWYFRFAFRVYRDDLVVLVTRYWRWEIIKKGFSRFHLAISFWAIGKNLGTRVLRRLNVLYKYVFKFDSDETAAYTCHIVANGLSQFRALLVYYDSEKEIMPITWNNAQENKELHSNCRAHVDKNELNSNQISVLILFGLLFNVIHECFVSIAVPFIHQGILFTKH